MRLYGRQRSFKRYHRGAAAMEYCDAPQSSSSLEMPSTAPSARLRRRGGDTDRATVVVKHYRSKLAKEASILEARLKDFDRDPGEWSQTLEVRSLRERIRNALEYYFAAAGSRDSTGIVGILDVVEKVDVLLQILDSRVCAEVVRFEESADTIRNDFRFDMSAEAKTGLAADATDLLLELVVYQASWDSALSSEQKDRLCVVQAELLSVYEACPCATSASLPTRIRSIDDRHGHRLSSLSLSRATSSRTASSSTEGGNSAFLRVLPAGDSGVPSEEGRRNSRPGFPGMSFGYIRGLSKDNRQETARSRGLHRSRRKRGKSFSKDFVADTQASIPRHRDASHHGPTLSENGIYQGCQGDVRLILPASGHNLCQNPVLNCSSRAQPLLVMSRSRTLRDMAKLAHGASRIDSGVCEGRGSSAVLGSQPLGEFTGLLNNPSADQRVVDGVHCGSQPSVTARRSFASMLYDTNQVRSELLSDYGVVLRVLVVRGDGRCLFRSLVRARAAARGILTVSEWNEREAADQLRRRTVRELKKHRELLTKFYVIETDLASYTRRMSQHGTFGGEPELLMLAKIVHVPIAVYISAHGRFRQIQIYGRQYCGKPLRILYRDGDHYDALHSESL